jgi:hypothetical protein
MNRLHNGSRMERMMEPSLTDIDDMIVHEKMQAALAMRETVRLHGEDGAEAMLNSLRERVLAGEFSPQRTLQ